LVTNTARTVSAWGGNDRVETARMGGSVFGCLRGFLRVRKSGTGGTPMSIATEETAVRGLYQDLLNAWNKRDARAMARLFISEGMVVGFDGSEMEGSAALEAEMTRIFADHVPARYVGLVRSVHVLRPDVAILHAVAGMVPPGKRDLKEENNAVQTLTAVKREDRWRIAVYHNTPAAYHGRPERARALTDELRQALQMHASDILET
jgi:uncharacterized protein (TIGR02246 family)